MITFSINHIISDYHYYLYNHFILDEPPGKRRQLSLCLQIKKKKKFKFIESLIYIF